MIQSLSKIFKDGSSPKKGGFKEISSFLYGADDILVKEWFRDLYIESKEFALAIETEDVEDLLGEKT